MALIAESFVEEWLNRTGFFTIRGIKHGVGELDLLGIKHDTTGTLVGWHVEVQASFRPIGYIGKLTPELLATDDQKPRSRSSARARSIEEIEICARDWVRHKFSSSEKKGVPDSLWPGIDWTYHLVHAEVRDERELEIFKAEGVECHHFLDVMKELMQRSHGSYSSSAGGDLAEILAYYTTKGLQRLA